MAIETSRLKKMICYLQSLVEAQELIAESERLKAEAEAAAAEKAEAADYERLIGSCQARILGGSGDKAAFLGTIASEPAVDEKALAEIGLEADAKELAAARDEVRQKALALTGYKAPVTVADAKEIKEL